MAFTIEIEDRDWDTSQISAALKVPAERGYTADLTVDEPERGRVVFQGDVALQALEGDVLVVAEFHEDEIPALIGKTHRFNVADIRRISFY